MALLFNLGFLEELLLLLRPLVCNKELLALLVRRRLES
jgi:hypothetical protein